MSSELNSATPIVHKRNIRRWFGLSLAIIAVSLVAWWFSKERAVDVRVATAEVMDIYGSFSAEGYVLGRDYELASEVGGRIVALNVREGDRIAKGGLILSVDSDDARKLLAESRAATRVALMESARAGSALKAAKTELEARIAYARAVVAQAESELVRARRATRKEEIEQAEQRLNKAEAILDEAKKQRERTRILVSEGALPRVALENAEARYATAAADAAEAKAFSAMLKAGPRVEDVATVQRQVESARANWQVARSGFTQLEPLRLQVAVANANVDKARATENRIFESIRRTDLRAPADGVVTKLRVESGSVVTSGVTVVTLSTREDIRVEAEIGSEDAGKIREGMNVQVSSPAYPGQIFDGVLLSTMPVGELKPDAAIRTRIVRARVGLKDKWHLLRPGMEVDVAGTMRLKATLCVPSDAVVLSDKGIAVYLIKDSRAYLTPVKIGFASAEQSEILSGLTAGKPVVIEGKDQLEPGSLVRVLP